MTSFFGSASKPSAKRGPKNGFKIAILAIPGFNQLLIPGGRVVQIPPPQPRKALESCDSKAFSLV